MKVIFLSVANFWLGTFEEKGMTQIRANYTFSNRVPDMSQMRANFVDTVLHPFCSMLLFIYRDGHWMLIHIFSSEKLLKGKLTHTEWGDLMMNMEAEI